MKLSSLLVSDQIVLGVRARTLAEAMPEIMNRVAGFRPSEPVGSLVEALLHREAQGSTALGAGIAIPHARVSGLRDFHLMLGVAREPLEDKGMDGVPVDLVFLILSSDQKNTVMLQTMAAIGTLAKDTERLNAVRRSDSPGAVWRLIEESRVSVKKGLFARDLMRETPVIAHEDMPLRELLDKLFEHGVHKAPVCSPTGEFIGAVTSQEIIEAGFPEYMSGIRDIGFLSEFEPFEEFFKQEGATRVGDILNRHPLIVDTDDPMIQVVFRMKQVRQRFAYVLEKGRYVGVIDRAEVLSRILRA